MSLAWSIERCAREYTKLTGRDAAEDGRLPYIEGVFAWRLERFRYDATSVLRTTLKTTRPVRGRKGLNIIARSECTTLQLRSRARTEGLGHSEAARRAASR